MRIEKLKSGLNSAAIFRNPKSEIRN